MKTICVAGQKGGSARTTTTYALAEALRQLGIRILMVDLDPQASLTAACGIEATSESLAEAMMKQIPLRATIYEVANGLDIVPSNARLADVELDMARWSGREAVLKNTLLEVQNDYDICLIDSPPSLQLLAINGLVASDAMIMPIVPQTNDIRALSVFLNTVEKAKQLNPDLANLGVLPVKVDTRLVHHRQALEILANADFPVFEEQIPRSIKLAESLAGFESIVSYDPFHAASEAYISVAKKIQVWLQQNG